MFGHGGSSAGSYLADPTSPIPSHCGSIVVTNTLRVNYLHLPFVNKLTSRIYVNLSLCQNLAAIFNVTFHFENTIHSAHLHFEFHSETIHFSLVMDVHYVLH